MRKEENIQNGAKKSGLPKKLQSLRIQERLNKSFTFAVSVASVAAIIALLLIFYMTSRYNHALTYYAFPQGDIGMAMHEFAEVRSSTRAVIGYEEQEAIDKAVAQHEEAVTELDQGMETVKLTLSSKEEKEAYAAIEKALEDYFAIEERVLEIGTTTDQELCIQAQNIAFDELAPAYATADEAFEHLMEVNVKKGDSQQNLLNVLRIASLFLVVFIIVLAFYLAKKIGKQTAKGIDEPINALIKRLDEFRDGDISSPFPEHEFDDEIGDISNEVRDTTLKLKKILDDMKYLLGEMANGNFNLRTTCEEEYVGEYRDLLLAIRQMNRQIAATLKEVKGASDMVSAGANNLAEASQDLAEGATDQAATVQEMQATIDVISNSLLQTADNVNAAYEKAKDCAAEAENGKSEMEIMLNAMKRIDETSQKIGNIIAEIEDIASQTNLLSLNAAIEAARAGDAGKGFAVVAEQIRTLADQSAKSAVNTRQLIEEALQEVQIGNEAVDRTSGVIEDVVASINQIADTSKMLSDMSQKQAEAMEQADQGVIRISEVVQANSAAAEESSATSEELSAQAISMDELVGRFQLRND